MRVRSPVVLVSRKAPITRPLLDSPLLDSPLLVSPFELSPLLLRPFAEVKGSSSFTIPSSDMLVQATEAVASTLAMARSVSWDFMITMPKQLLCEPLLIKLCLFFGPPGWTHASFVVNRTTRPVVAQATKPAEHGHFLLRCGAQRPRVEGHAGATTTLTGARCQALPQQRARGVEGLVDDRWIGNLLQELARPAREGATSHEDHLLRLSGASL